MAIVATPLKRALSIARMSNLDPTGWTSADWMDHMGLNVPEAQPAPAATEEPDPFTVTAEEQAEFRKIATSATRHDWLEAAATFAPFIESHGAYPAKGLDPAGLGRKTQTTRMLKCVCPKCGYKARVARMWLERAGAPICPVDEEPMTCAQV